MNLGSIDPLLLLASLMVAATPILLAAIGELVVERAGVLNLGVEGMMITGAICGFAIAVETGSPAIRAAVAADVHVVSSGSTPAEPYDTWAKAATDVHSAVSLAGLRDTVIIENTPIDYLDFASPVSGLGGKIGLYGESP